VASYTEQNEGKTATTGDNNKSRTNNGKKKKKKKRTTVNLLKSQKEQKKERKCVYKKHNLTPDNDPRETNSATVNIVCSPNVRNGKGKGNPIKGLHRP
jgi:hypothetical protein